MRDANAYAEYDTMIGIASAVKEEESRGQSRHNERKGRSISNWW